MVAVKKSACYAREEKEPDFAKLNLGNLESFDAPDSQTLVQYKGNS
jgi:hypothetical protein